MLKVLIVDGDVTFARALQTHLSQFRDVSVETVKTPADGVAAVRAGRGDLVFLASEPRDAFGALDDMKRARPETEIVLTATASRLDAAVRAMKSGAADYLVKPLKPEQVAVAIERARRSTRASAPAAPPGDARIVGTTPGIVRLNEQIARASPDGPALIVGAPGTEKERVARALHRAGPFAVAAADLEAALRAADGGSLFIEEVVELSAAGQAVLARAMIEGVLRVGGTDEGVRVRVLAGTSANLLESVGRGLFRHDLLERLSVQTVAIPPLRERMDDIALLVDAALKRRAAAGKRVPRSVSAEAMATLMGHDWPGNAAELDQAVERACELGDGDLLERRHLPPSVVLAAEARRISGATDVNTRSLREMESEVIRKLLVEHRGDTEVVSRLLKIDRSTLYRKIKRYDIDLDGMKS